MTRTDWYLRRALAMTPREIVWRVGRAGRDLVRADRVAGWARDRGPDAGVQDWDGVLQRFRAGDGRPVLLDRVRAERIGAQCPDGVAAVVDRADRILAGEVRYFGYPVAHLGSPIDWSLDPLTGRRWPAIAATRIDHRTASADPKWIWELNRLQHVPWLAQAWLFTGDERYAEAAFAHLDSWIEQNPVGVGIAWRGAFESGLRAVSVAVALQGLRDCKALSPARFRRVVEMLDTSARYCWRGRSRFTSANNHVIGELTGVVCVTALLPELRAADTLCERAIHTLSVEADLQILPDGMGAEQSVCYHIFTAEALTLVAAVTALRRRPVPAPITAAIDRSAQFLAAVVGAGDPQPRYGDDDGSFVLRLGAESERTVRDHLGIVAAVTGSPEARWAGRATLSSAWLGAALADSDAQARVAGRRPPAGHSAPGFYARDGGLVVLRAGARRVTMDVGPLGYLTTAAHGHADALAVTLASGGRELIGDPGTGSYYGDPAQRSAHRGTAAHPTVCVDDSDQSVMGGAFLWTRHARVTVHAVDLGRGIVDAEHDGYRRLDDSVRHRRWLVAPGDGGTIAVVDLIRGRARHRVRVGWPLHPSLAATVTGCGHTAARGAVPVLQVEYAATAPFTTQQLCGDDRSRLGWWSDRLESWTPSWLVGVECAARLPVAVLTLLRPLGDTAARPVTAARIEWSDSGSLVASWSESGFGHRVTVDCVRGGAVVAERIGG
ncbi:conserved hypothetical protein [Rhodococcus sp. RD6.2]|uniref:alginate lyase family protein n=1 Tax=Rhodococcus sp. RD6.2 TaxID=260936 RepID=UPI00063BBFAA|nr:alginate lyase family protein [Rhodococcus sp. RD6.2]CRK49508.1 conserved hypothetical protein [Rhodococcus sp. RD6.2]